MKQQKVVLNKSAIRNPNIDVSEIRNPKSEIYYAIKRILMLTVFLSGLLPAQESKIYQAFNVNSESCMKCHNGTESMHADGDKEIGISCAGCHGGDGSEFEMEKAHVQPKQKDIFKTSANPKFSYSALNNESPEFIRFMNPGDFRVADQTCGKCHQEIFKKSLTSCMAHSGMIPQAGTYNNGIFDAKVAIFGESYMPDGTPAGLLDESYQPTGDIPNDSRVRSLLPFPEFASIPATDAFRVLERGNNDAGERGPGTDFHVAGGGIVINKTRLNDPTLWFMGTNQTSGDYRSSGCTGCHVMYANDRDFDISGPEIAEFYENGGKSGHTATADRAIPHDEPGHPVAHKMTTRIAISQCLTCHHHQGNGAMGNYIGAIWWDQESDAGKIFGKDAERDKYIDEQRRQLLYPGNKLFSEVQLEDAHGHSWNYRKVYKLDRKGNFLDGDGNIIPHDDPEKFKKAVHLKDIHFQAGMHCIDCHTEQDMHGDGKIWGAMIDAVEIRCEDCHGTPLAPATLITSGVASSGNTNLGDRLSGPRTPFGKRQFESKSGKLIQRSKMYEDLEWEIPQIATMLDPQSAHYNEKAARAHTMQKDGETWGETIADHSQLAHSPAKVECYTCHSAWNTQCYGCHLSAEVNRKWKGLHYEGEETRAEVYYNPQVLRSDAYMIGVNGTSKGNKYSPMRSASAVVVTTRDRGRNVVVHQQPTIAASGHSGFAVSPNAPHTVRLAETKTCTNCHISERNDNNAWLAATYGFGTNYVNFVGEYAYVAVGKKGVQAVKVTEGWEPQPVIGSRYHQILHPDSYEDFINNDRKLDEARNVGSNNARSIAARGEFIFIADGPGGLRVYDRANIANKTKAQRLVESQNTRFGQQTRVDTKDATCIALPTTVPMDPNRVQRPENRETPVADIFRYAYLTDREEGLIVIDVQTFHDNDPQNNYIKRATTYNPQGILSGAVKIKIAGDYAYIVSEKTGFHVIDIRDPLSPQRIATIGSPDITASRSLAIQFRYAFIADKDGVKTINISNPDEPRIVPGARITLSDARDVYPVRTYLYVSGGPDGIVIIDIENPESPVAVGKYTANGRLNDVNSLTTGAVNASMFAFVADGKNGLRIVRLIGSPDTPGHMGFSPMPVPQLIATFKTKAPALTIAEGMKRDRPVDESGNQIGVAGRLGSRPLGKENLESLTRRNGEVFKVRDEVIPATTQAKK